MMNKYLAILDQKTLALSVVCIVITYLSFRFNFSYDLNITLFSVAVIFPLVFTIREAFKRRDSALKFLSLFRASMTSVHYCFEQCKKLEEEEQNEVRAQLQKVSDLFFVALTSEEADSKPALEALNGVFHFIQRHNDAISSGLTLKIIRFVQDANESIENTISLKLHGTPISMRAYCLVFVFLFPFVFAPTIVYHLPDAPPLITYGLSLLHAFVLISLYNVQTQMENPFDQVGLDDIKLGEYAFKPIERVVLPKKSKVATEADPEVNESAAADTAQQATPATRSEAEPPQGFDPKSGAS
ncbi:MAG: hypothetical protein Cons2KO_12520 [Congregibacter sp.]